MHLGAVVSLPTLVSGAPLILNRSALSLKAYRYERYENVGLVPDATTTPAAVVMDFVNKKIHIAIEALFEPLHKSSSCIIVSYVTYRLWVSGFAPRLDN